MERARPVLATSIQAFLEYARVGAPASPWGVHARISAGLGTWRHGAIQLGLSVGPLRLLRQDAIIDSNVDSACFGRAAFGGRVAQGVDLSIRLLLDRSLVGMGPPCPGCGSHLRFGLLYDIQGQDFLQFPCVPQK